MLSQAATPRTKARKPRTCYDKFDMPAMEENFKEITSLRNPGVEWNGEGYQKKRDDPPDPRSLKDWSMLLRALFAGCPSGYPYQTQVTDLVMRLVVSVPEILSEVPAEWKDLSQDDVAARIADKWRTMMKHIVVIKSEYEKTGETPNFKEIAELVPAILPMQIRHGIAQP